MRHKGVRSFINFLAYAVIRILYAVFQFIPFETCMKLADLCSPAISFLLPIRKGIVLQNLERAFPKETSQTLNRIMRKTYRHFLLFMIEFIHLGKRTSGDLSRQIVEIEGWEHVQNALNEEKPILAVTGHLGNWELMGAYFASRGMKFSVPAKPIHNPYVNKFVNRVRKEKGIDVISTREFALKSILKTIREGNGLVFIADQDARRDGVFIDFFGIPASTFTAPAVFSLRTGVPLIPLFGVRKDLLTHKVIIHPPIYPQTGDREKAILNMMREYTLVLEDMIRKYPEQYFWFHRRWKTKPRGRVRAL